MSAEKFWDKQAASYVKSAIGDEDAYAQGLARVMTHLSSDMDVMEFGCGTGMTALKLAPHVRSYMGTDVSGNMIAECEKRHAAAPVPQVRFQRAVLGDVSEGPFDAILGFNILHLIRDVDGALADAHRLLNPGGLLITKTVCKPEKFSPGFSAMLMVGRVMRIFNPGLFFRIETTAAVDARIGAAGFDVIETGNYPQNPPGHLVVAKRR